MRSLVPRSRGSRIYLLLLLGVAGGLALVGLGAWRVGVLAIGVSFLVGAVARVVTPQDHVGMLRVRGKAFDIFWMTTLGASLVVLSVVVPPGPPA
ncbi:DUF3017 domain-containing protein [Aeromicrobium sp. CF4.19]|uniref:DUF3017 domain-containing protein n=1 Tax=Aeromicrobium sp. CF4.19 TaxID=3373082 RepID=UPI003EE8198C